MTNEAKSQQIDRRRLLALGVQGGVVAGLGLSASPAKGGQETFTATGFKHASDLTVMANGQVAVIGDRKLVILSAEGETLHIFPLDQAPQAVCAGAQGGLFLATQEAVLSLGDQGQLLKRWLLPEANGIAVTSISADSDLVYIGDGVHGKVHRFSLTGQHQGTLERSFAAAPNFFPVEVDAQGRVHVAHSARHRVETFDRSGRTVARWGAKARDAAGFSGCCNPVDLALLPDGKFVTAERGQPRVKLFSAQGEYLETLADPEHFTKDRLSSYDNHSACSGGGLSVAAGPRGEIYVLDHADASLSRLT